MSPKKRNVSRDGLVKLWEGGFVICNTITLWNNHVICVNTHIKRVDCFYNSASRSFHMSDVLDTFAGALSDI